MQVKKNTKSHFNFLFFPTVGFLAYFSGEYFLPIVKFSRMYKRHILLKLGLVLLNMAQFTYACLHARPSNKLVYSFTICLSSLHCLKCAVYFFLIFVGQAHSKHVHAQVDIHMNRYTNIPTHTHLHMHIQTLNFSKQFLCI